MIVDFDLKYLNFSAKTKHTVKMAVNVDNVPRFFLFQSFQNIRAAQGFRNSQSKIQNYHEYSDEDHLLPRQELSGHLYPDTFSPEVHVTLDTLTSVSGHSMLSDN